jgi:hypothetical protein
MYHAGDLLPMVNFGPEESWVQDKIVTTPPPFSGCFWQGFAVLVPE